MKIFLSPQRRDDTLIIVKLGDKLTVNDIDYDFTDLQEGEILPKEAVDCYWIISDVIRTAENGIELTFLFPNGPNASHAARFPDPILNPPDGIMELPI